MLKYEIVELAELSGAHAKVYSIVPCGSQASLFECFLTTWKKAYPDELKDLIGRLQLIGNAHGAREGYFRHDEGKPGDGVCALYDRPDAKLRLYCIRYGQVAVILGGGGPKKVRSWQDDPILAKEARQVIRYANDINKRLKEGVSLYWSPRKDELLGDLKNFDDEDE